MNGEGSVLGKGSRSGFQKHKWEMRGSEVRHGEIGRREVRMDGCHLEEYLVIKGGGGGVVKNDGPSIRMQKVERRGDPATTISNAWWGIMKDLCIKEFGRTGK